jgi:transcriptional regulator with XRE-family HTH domain
VGAIERGEINPTFRILSALSRSLSVPLSELLVVFERQLVALPSRDGEEAAGRARSRRSSLASSDAQASTPGQRSQRRMQRRRSTTQVL